MLCFWAAPGKTPCCASFPVFPWKAVRPDVHRCPPPARVHRQGSWCGTTSGRFQPGWGGENKQKRSHPPSSPRSLDRLVSGGLFRTHSECDVYVPECVEVHIGKNLPVGERIIPHLDICHLTVETREFNYKISHREVLETERKMGKRWGKWHLGRRKLLGTVLQHK